MSDKQPTRHLKPLHPMMLVGTASDVGKSILATAFCRIFLQDGYKPAPFKAQNMSLNSFATTQGAEIGRAQAVQAEAAGIPPHTDMNPVLLKPTTDNKSQIILNGRPAGTQTALQYFRNKRSKQLHTLVCQAYNRLAAGGYNPIVLEGAGSISEINLRQTDIANLTMAQHAQADVFLVGDIDRGGLFASLYGTMQLLQPHERAMIKGIIVNKFRGDIKLFQTGIEMLQDLCRVPVVGIVPFYQNIHIEQEDSVALRHKTTQTLKGKINIAVILLKHLSNYTDFDTLERDNRVNLFYTREATQIQQADIIIIPGSKSTIDDLSQLRRDGIAHAIFDAKNNGKTILGICGGYQMMGQEIADPRHTESNTPRMPGLNLLPVKTTLTPHKTTRQTTFLMGDTTMTGYEIHCGITTPTDTQHHTPLFHLPDGTPEGCTDGTQCMGTYIHGVLDNTQFVDHLLKPFIHKTHTTNTADDYNRYKQTQYDLLAQHVRTHVDMNQIYHILKTDKPQ